MCISICRILSSGVSNFPNFGVIVADVSEWSSLLLGVCPFSLVWLRPWYVWAVGSPTAHAKAPEVHRELMLIKQNASTCTSLGSKIVWKKNSAKLLPPRNRNWESIYLRYSRWLGLAAEVDELGEM